MAGPPHNMPFENIRVLLLEDNPADKELLECHLREAGFVFNSKTVDSRKTYTKALREFHPDLILSDYDLPAFTGTEALQIRKKLCPETPFILVTGAIGEERAIEVLTGGATDYVLKKNLSRLLPAIQRALKEACEHKMRRSVEAELEKHRNHLTELIKERTSQLETEIGERRRAEEALRESEEKYRLIYETNLNGILFTIPGERVISANPAAQRILGMTEKEIIEAGKEGILDVSDPRTGPALEERARTGKFIGELKCRKKGGKTFIAEGSATLFKNKRGQAFSSIIFHDVTWRRKAAQKLKENEQRLEEANRELESFTYSVSHDLRAPLRAIDGFSAMLKDALDGRSGQEEKRKIDLIRENVRKMNHLIDDLLSLSRVGRSEVKREKIDMNKLAASAWKQQLLVNPKIAVALEIGDLPEAVGDGSLVFQVFSNLLSNAVKYSRKRKKPVIRIGSEIQAEGNVYHVRDNGAGFNMKYSDKLFGVFQRLHSESEYEGTGVGLAIIQRIVNRHGGRVWAEGKVGKGATFYFSLPNR